MEELEQKIIEKKRFLEKIDSEIKEKEEILRNERIQEDELQRLKSEMEEKEKMIQECHLQMEDMRKELQGTHNRTENNIFKTEIRMGEDHDKKERHINNLSAIATSLRNDSGDNLDNVKSVESVADKITSEKEFQGREEIPDEE